MLSARFGRITSRQVAVAIAAIVLVVSIQQYQRRGYNNYLVFASSLKVLLSHQDLYVPHPEYHADLYKYSPTFPLFMAPFTWQPVFTGLLCWSLLNALMLLAAIKALWRDDDRRVVITMAVLTIELIGSLQNAQSNALLAALVVLTFVDLERLRSWRAGFLIAVGFFLKGYGAAVGVLALVYPHRLRVAGAAASWGVVLALAPLIVLSASELRSQYADWLSIRETFSLRNASVMRVWARYIDPDVNPFVIQAVGALVFFAPFVRFQAWRDPLFRLHLLCSLLLAMVIFNDSAEPPTYIVAVTGGAIWFAAGPERSRLERGLTLAMLLAVSLISTDIYPRSLRATIAGPYTAKALGCFILWVRVNWELLTRRYQTASGTAVSAPAKTSG